MLNLSPKLYDALKKNRLLPRRLNSAVISVITTGLAGRTVYRTDINEGVVYLRRPLNWDSELYEYLLTTENIQGIRINTLNVDNSGFNLEIDGSEEFDWDLLTCPDCGNIECECCSNCGNTYDNCTCCPQCGRDLEGSCRCPKCQECGQIEEFCYCEPPAGFSPEEGGV